MRGFYTYDVVQNRPIIKRLQIKLFNPIVSILRFALFRCCAKQHAHTEDPSWNPSLEVIKECPNTLGKIILVFNLSK
jgi:hypothetical protein